MKQRSSLGSKIALFGILAVGLLWAESDGQDTDAAQGWAKLQAQVSMHIGQVADSCVALETRYGQIGSGVMVSESGLIFSAAHLVRNVGEVVKVRSYQKHDCYAVVIGENVAMDAAVLRLRASMGVAVAPVAHSTAVYKEPTTMLAVGHASGFCSSRPAEVRLGFGYIGANQQRLVSSCAITKGDSGGGIFSANGELLGINIAMSKNNGASEHLSVDIFFRLWPDLVQEVFPKPHTS